MAIDTKQKRLNMLSVCSPLAWQLHFEVDGSVDADDRGHLLHLYSGNAFANPIAPTDGTRRQRQMKALIKSNRRRKC